MIVEIQYNDQVLKDPEAIQNAVCDVYDKFCSQPVDLDQFRVNLMRFPPTVDNVTKANLEESFTVEVKKAIDDLSPGKSPAPDGLGAAFYKAFRNDLSPVLCELFKESYKQERLPPSFSRSHTVLIPKTDISEELRKLTAYRPVTIQMLITKY